MGSAGPLHTGRLTWNAPQTCELWFLFNSQLPSVFFPGSFFPQQVLIANVTKDWPLRSQPHAQPNTQRDPMLFSVAPSLTSSLFSRTIPHRSQAVQPLWSPISLFLALFGLCLPLLCPEGISSRNLVTLLFPVSGGNQSCSQLHKLWAQLLCIFCQYYSFLQSRLFGSQLSHHS